MSHSTEVTFYNTNGMYQFETGSRRLAESCRVKVNEEMILTNREADEFIQKGSMNGYIPLMSEIIMKMMLSSDMDTLETRENEIRDMYAHSYSSIEEKNCNQEHAARMDKEHEVFPVFKLRIRHFD